MNAGNKNDPSKAYTLQLTDIFFTKYWCIVGIASVRCKRVDSASKLDLKGTLSYLDRCVLKGFYVNKPDTGHVRNEMQIGDMSKIFLEFIFLKPLTKVYFVYEWFHNSCAILEITRLNVNLMGSLNLNHLVDVCDWSKSSFELAVLFNQLPTVLWKSKIQCDRRKMYQF